MKYNLWKVLMMMLLLGVALLAVSCQNGTPPGVDGTQGPVDVGAVIAGDEGSVYTVIHPTKWTDIEYNAAKDLQSTLKSKYASYPALKNDTVEDVEGAYEILIGNTNRPESAAALEGLNEYGWAVRVIGNCIVINAKNDMMLSDAVDYFINTYITDATEIGINSIAEHIENQEKYNNPFVFSVGNRSVYTVRYSSKSSSYLQGSALAFSKAMKKNNVAVSATSGSVKAGKTVTVTTSSSINGWEINFEENGNITVKGETDAMAAVALNYFSSEILKKDADGDIIIQNPQKLTNSAEAYAREGWELAVPAYEGGVLSQHLYDAGNGVSKESGSASAEKSYMVCISETNMTEFNRYLEKLSDCGYRIDSENMLSSSTGKTNSFVSYKKGSQYLYVYYLAETGEVRVIEDRGSVAESEFEYTFEYNSNTAAEIYLYGMKYAADGSDGNNNGSFIIVKQADGSVMLIDGGSENQATPAAVAGLLDFLYSITGQSSSEKIVISCWFITHAHGDHYALSSQLMSNYYDKIDLQRVMFNFPSATETGLTDVYDKARDAISTCFPHAKFMKCHTGQSIQLGSIRLDVLTTHEDAVSAKTGKTLMTEGNSMTTVLRITLPDGTRFMCLGDYTAERQDAFLKMYASAELKSQITDVAHHGYNAIPNIYKAVGAKYALWSNYRNDQFSGWHLAITAQVTGHLQDAGVQEIYYAGLNTVKLECRGGTVTVTKLPLVY